MRIRKTVLFLSPIFLVIAAALLSLTETGKIEPASPPFAAADSLPIAIPLTELLPAQQPQTPQIPRIYGSREPEAATTDTGPAARNALIAFDNWLARFVENPASPESSFLAEGRQLAIARRAAMVDLIRRDPQQALARAVSPQIQNLLPPEIRDQLEEHFDAHGDLEVTLICDDFASHAAEHSDSVSRHLTLPNERLEAFVYGRRETQTTKYDIPVHGIRLDDVAALAESPIRFLADFESSASGEIRLQIGDEQISVENPEIAHLLENQLIAAEGATGPEVFHSTETAAPLSTNAATSWTTGEKRVLYLRLDFSDLPGEPISTQSAADALAEADAFFRENSGHRTSLSPTVLPETLRLPQTAAWYRDAGYLQLRDDALAAAREFDSQNGGTDSFNPDRYDLLVLAFHPVFSGWGGRAAVGGRDVWLNGQFDAGITAHEIGHNYGVFHANAWEPSGNNPAGEGRHLEYADRFDVMGISSNVFGGDFQNGHFNTWFKTYLGWFAPEEAVEITEDGTYRLYRHDHPDSAGLQAIRIHADEGRSYWLGVRRLFAGNQWLNNGIEIRRAQTVSGLMSSQGSQLLDMSPQSTHGFDDHALLIGQTFSDFENGIAIRAVASGGEGANAYVDVEISRSNAVPPVIQNHPTPQSGVEGGAVAFHVTASGTAPLSYQWLKNNVEIPGATDSSLRLANLTALDAAEYAVRVANAYGAVTSEPALLTVSPANSVRAGSVDSSFDPLAGPDGPVYAIAVQTDGKILIGGNFTRVAGISRNRVARLHADGSLDTGFDPGSGFDNVVWNLALQADGKILVGGVFTRFNGNPAGRIVRLHPDGTLDTAFATGIGADQAVRVILPQDDGRILVGGAFAQFNHSPAPGLIRLFADGQIDPSFNPGTGVNGAVWSLAVHDGGLYAGGAFSAFNGTSRAGIVRLLENGEIDPAFNPGTGANGAIYAILPEENGGIVAAGSFSSFAGISAGRIVRLTADGNVDSGFHAAEGADDFIWSLARQTDGKIVAAGWFSKFDNISRNGIARLTQDGKLDSTFEPGTGASDFVWPAALQNDGSVLIGGRFFQVDGVSRNRIARLHGDVSFPAETESTYERWIAEQPISDPESSPTADPDGLGIPNLLRYAFGIDTSVPDQTKLPKPGQSWSPTASGTEPSLTITFHRRKDAADLDYIVEGSTDLRTWKPLAAPEIIRIEDAGLTEIVTVRDESSASHPARFLRVRVLLQ